MSELKVGDTVRWNIDGDDILDGMWIVGCLVQDRWAGLEDHTCVRVQMVHPRLAGAFPPGSEVHPMLAELTRAFQIGHSVRWWPDASDAFPVEQCTRWLDGVVDRVEGGRPIGMLVADVTGLAPREHVGVWHYIGGLGLVRHMVVASCDDRCSVPASGGACTVCGFPKAAAHPDCISAALGGVDAVYVNGSALVIASVPEFKRGIVVITRRDGTEAIYPIPGWSDGLPARECWLRWNENHYNIEGGLTICHMLTDAQIRLAKDFHRAEVFPVQSFLLRLRVETTMAADRGREISVVLPDYDLETANSAEPTMDEISAFNRRGE